MKKGENRGAFIATSIFLFFLTAFFVWCLVNVVFAGKYPPADSLTYDECTLVEYELITTSKRAYYYIYVEEHQKPLEIDSIVIDRIDRDALLALNPGDTMVVSTYEGKKALTLYSLSHGNKTILAYEDYLAEHNENNTVGIVFTSIASFVSLGLFIGNMIYYRKKGNILPV